MPTKETKYREEARSKSKRTGGKRYKSRLAASSMLAAALIMAAPSSSEASVRAPQSAGAPTVLTMEDYYTADPGFSAWNTLTAEYHALHPNVTFKRTPFPSAEYLSHILEQAGSNSLPDLLMIDNPYVSEVAATGVLVPLQSIGHLDTSDIVPTELYDGYYNGKMYGLALYTNTTALFYNKTMFAAANLTPPKTWAQLESDAKALTTKNVYGFVTSLMPTSSWAEWILFPLLWTNQGTNALDDLTSPKASAALNVLVTMERDGSMPKAEVDWNPLETEELFDTGKAAMEQDGSWTISTRDTVKGLNYGVAPLPVRQIGQRLLVPTGGEVWTIPKSNPTTEKAALQFLQWLEEPSTDVHEAVLQGGLVPTVKAAIPGALKLEDPVHMAAFATELEEGGTARANTLHNPQEFNTIATIVGNAVDAAVIGPTTAKQALDNIAAEVAADDK
jgi:multiple sugar transport system substrate-binding protein